MNKSGKGGRPLKGEGGRRIMIFTYKEDRDKMEDLIYKLKISRSQLIRELINKEYKKYFK